ncbi:Outer membrane protein beta-barrel domain-containing protein [Ekhidna lutea]|uniref:Outer membrane protein beta-barrel domain-containing protein n=1 Tax=Ekhidna lutea TaxID=447679 RepID=A0A239KFW2_EKHLU|nr:outer membrane beta-barrel protein [Ekhidna lutea]SNT17256.1 Outer membrane protein beta-barrel domain-containing protein [Ekhidna lutea]
MKYLIGVFFSLTLLSASAQDGMKRPDIPGDLMVDVGFNVWSSMPGPLKKKVFASKSIGVYYSKRKVLNNKLSFNYGLGLGMEKISLGDSSTLFSNTIVDDTLRSVVINPNPHNFDKNRLAVTYLDIPLELRFHPKGTEEGEGLFIGAGAIIGLRLNAHTKWKYENNGETVIEKTSGEFNLNSLRYGYQVRAGFKGVHFFYKRYTSNVFQDSFQDGSNPVMTTIGINVTGF